MLTQISRRNGIDEGISVANASYIVFKKIVLADTITADLFPRALNATKSVKAT